MRAEDENETAVGRGLGHDLVPSLRLNELQCCCLDPNDVTDL